jgi:regulator of sirC expression with transglutaminase-like and TPR domain
VQRLLDALRDERSKVTLDVAALEMASIEFPGLDLEGSLVRLDSLAQQTGAQLSEGASGLDFIKAANEVLFEVMQFRGNESEYYDPRNSCLNSWASRSRCRLSISKWLAVWDARFTALDCRGTLSWLTRIANRGTGLIPFTTAVS